MHLRLTVAVLLTCRIAVAASAEEPNTIPIHRIDGGITIDGRLDEPAWRQAARVTRWYETRPGDNIEPRVSNTAYLAYDDEFLYAAFEFEDPDPEQIRAPLGDRDNVPSSTDYGGLILDTRNDGKTAQMFLANPRGIQYDAITSDASGEDPSPDFFWESAGRIGEDGWTLEIRIPFSSLRYADPDPEQWGVLLYRNWPRNFRCQMFSSRLPRDVNCFICNVKPLVGLAGLPSGSHWVVAPYGSGTQLSAPRGELGTPLRQGDADGEIGVDAKWIPNPDTVIDATLNPDFSQIESDVAQITANEQFALFFPEKRPFFLESVDLLATPITAAYTRSITSPDWGMRATGSAGTSHYTVLVAQDAGGGSVILPGPTGSGFAKQDYESLVGIARLRRDFGLSSASLIYSGREIEGGGYNRVAGPDFRWQPTEKDTVTGQLLYSWTETPDRTDLADEWDGRGLDGHALELWWFRDTGKWDFFTLVHDFGEGFRADNGYVPRVGHRRGIVELGRTFYPDDNEWISRLRTFVVGDYLVDREGEVIRRQVMPGFGLDGRWSSFFRVELRLDEALGDIETFDRQQLWVHWELSPARWITRLTFETTVGDEIDYSHDRLGDLLSLAVEAEVRPTDHLQLQLLGNWRTVDVRGENGVSGALFEAWVARLKAVYLFSSRSWIRLIGQYVETENDPRLWEEEVAPKEASFGGSAVFAFKLNWQSVLYLGYARNLEYLEASDSLESAESQLFLKVSYAFQG